MITKLTGLSSHKHNRCSLPKTASTQCCIAFILTVVLSGCTTTQKATTPLHEVDTQFKAGSSYVAVTYVEPWDRVKQQLKPDFDMSGEKALSKVIPQTSNALNRLLNVTSASLGVGFAGTTTNSTVTQDQTNDQTPTTQRHSVQQTTPGEAPAPSQTAIDRNAKDVGGTDVLGKEMAQEPMLQYSAALALDQEVQLLNRYVSGAPSRSGYKPYLVRLQVTLFPFARYEPYDGYTNISFFSLFSPNTNVSATNPALTPFVIPLVVTDSMEGTLTSTSNETVRKFALALGGVIQNAQAKADLQNLADQLHSNTGTDLNSLQSIGRSNDNSIQVRFGAQRSPIGDGAYVMVPRTHNVTLLLLAPRDLQIVKLTSRTVFHHATTGKRLEAINKDEFRSAITEISSFYQLDESMNSDYLKTSSQRADEEELERYKYKKMSEAPSRLRLAFKKMDAQKTLKAKFKNSGCSSPTFSLPDNNNEIENNKLKIFSHLMSLVGDNNYSCFLSEMSNYFTSVDDHTFLWNDLSRLASSYGYAGTSFQLPAPPETKLPPSQTVMLEDDGADSSTARIIGGRQLSPDNLFATLAGKSKNGVTLKLAALSSSITENSLTLSFPSPTKLGLSVEGVENGIKLTHGSGTDEKTENYPVIVSKAEPKVELGFTLESAVTAIPVKADNTGQVSVYLGFVEKGANKVKISVSGGEIRSAAHSNNKSAFGTPLPVVGGIVTAAGEAGSRAEIILNLGNILGGGVLKITGTGLNKAGGKLGDTIFVSISLKEKEGTAKKGD